MDCFLALLWSIDVAIEVDLLLFLLELIVFGVAVRKLEFLFGRVSLWLLEATMSNKDSNQGNEILF